MPTVPGISFSAVSQLGFWASALEDITVIYPSLRRDAPPRGRTYMPPFLPAKEAMDDIYRLQRAVDQSMAWLRDNATDVEGIMVRAIIEWLARVLKTKTRRMQHKIWILNPDRMAREFLDGNFHFVDGQPVMGPDPNANAGANAGGNAAGDAGDN